MVEAASTSGFIGTVEAIELLTADISDQEFEEARAGHPAWPAAASANNVERGEIREINVERDFIGEVLARPAAKRELAITLLTTALCNSTLLIWVQLSATGARIQITATNLRTTALLRESIVGGIVRAFPDEYLTRYDGEELLLSRAEFQAWRKSRLRPDQSVSASASDASQVATAPLKTKKWLTDEIKRRKGIGDIPAGITEFSRELHAQMLNAAKDGKVEHAVIARRIEAVLRDIGSSLGVHFTRTKNARRTHD
jgi:hypothetical protein